MTSDPGISVGGRSAYHNAIEQLHDAKLQALRKRLADSSTTGERAAIKRRIKAEIQDHKAKVAEIRGVLF